MLPTEVQAVIRKPEAERTPAEQKLADDYFPVLRIDPGKIAEVLSEADRQKYQELRRQLDQVPSAGTSLPVFWTVEVDPARELQKSYLLTSGDPDRPERNHEVEPGWPFGPARPDLREGRVEAFSDWLTTPDNPLFARVAVNRIWQWHFGEPLHSLPSDFGSLAGTPSQVSLLNWLASEFVARGFSMRQLHRLIVTSEAYRRSSEAVKPAVSGGDPAPVFARMPLRRLDAETVWDSIFSAAGILDPAVGGPSFDPGTLPVKLGEPAPSMRRAAYLLRGYSASREVMTSMLQTFDADDGRAPCPVRTRTVTAPQSLFLMNSPEITRAADAFGRRLESESGGDFQAAVELGYRIALARPPSGAEREEALRFLDGDPHRLGQLAWILFNLDEFVFIR